MTIKIDVQIPAMTESPDDKDYLFENGTVEVIEREYRDDIFVELKPSSDIKGNLILKVTDVRQALRALEFRRQPDPPEFD